MQAGLHYNYPEIFAEPYDSDGYYMSVRAPEPGDDETDSWDIKIGRWEPDDPDEEDGSATGSAVLRCVPPAPPDANQIANLLNQLAQQPDLLAQWAETSVGAALVGTELIAESYVD
ncbi:hypothetical protein ACFQ7F_31955 [Streptomyces sp. NPDC056486]|uniref:hypothetical protein n=1 Tax=Streptomyces sp. NPDC056486 TaxID=3345835 RepID=UPI0036C4E926